MRTSWIVVMAFFGAGFASGSARAQAEDLSGQGRAEAVGRGLIGSPAPRVVLEAIDGQRIDLGELYGKKAVYLKFWATWCVPCRMQMPHFERTWRQAATDLAVIGVNVGFNDSREDVLRYREDIGISMPLVIDDGTLAAALDLRVTPQHVVIGRDARIQYIGHLADEQLEAALRRARAPAPAAAASVSPTESRASAAGTPSMGTAATIGDRLPALTLTTLAGETFATSSRGDGRRGTALVFFTPWCESYLESSRAAVSDSCRRVREQVEALRRTHGDVRWLGVSSGIWATEGELVEYQGKYATTLSLALDADGQWFRAFRVMSVPTIVLADAEGRIVRRIEGYDQNLAVELRAMGKPN